MLLIHTSLLYFHIALGAVALILFWLPVFSRKGSKLHVNAGSVFYYLMLVIAASGMALCVIGLADPIAIYAADKALTAAQQQRLLIWRIPFSQFLLLLSLLTWVTVRHAVAALRVKENRAILKGIAFQGPNLMLIPGGIYVLWQGIGIGMPLLIIFAIVSIITSLSICLYIYQRQIKPRQWIIEHFSAMIGSGIALYTAFFAAGGRRILAQWLPGEWQIVSWLAAPVIGVSAMILLTGYYKRKYKVQHHKALQQA
ncbi:hypothetical protein WG68_06340 [Arsukibacterium ikkense]|uniref:DUF2306 domain-containing protein n=1 Tax=Arsukibacterium ikkense TaxID=336831 RepID=A0A0M2V9Q4_9GAMM|nr:hypothetical protein [Arsukibacterium ikkense]KKO46380.1 hypothetical protein WG68_06340 [Arsukibacterium ikkense]